RTEGIAMNGVHDLGGMHGFGPVVIEPDEPVFHARWEGRLFAMYLAMGAWRRWNIDMGRFAREQMPAAEYLAASYYEGALWRPEHRLERQGFLAGTDTAGRARDGGCHAPAGVVEPQAGALRRGDVARLLWNRRGAHLDDPVPPKFKAGDAVVARNMNPAG